MKKNKLKTILSAALSVIMLLMSFPFSAGAALTADNNLKFNSDGSFKILVYADCQDDTNPDKRMINFIKASLDYEKPDLVVFTGDNVVVSTSTSFRTGAQKLLQPLIDRNIPYAYTFGNHDDEKGVSKSTMHSIYKSLGNCLTYNADSSITGFGNCNLPILSSDGTDISFNLWMIDSNTYASGGYDNVHADQQTWYVNTSNALKAQAGHDVNSILFQHIIVPEGYQLLKENSSGSKTYLGKTYELSLNSNASGYLGEWPCPPVSNSGQFQTIVNQGDVLAMVFGHDHSNSFKGTIQDVDLLQTPGMSFESYGDSNCRGYRVIELDESDTSDYSTHTIKYSDYEAGIFESNPGTEDGITEYYAPAGTQYISDLYAAADGSADTAKAAITNNGYTLIDYDLNTGGGGKYIYMGYKTTTNYADAIKAVRFYNASGATSTASYVSRVNNNNCTFNVESFVDLNSGGGGNYIYTYATKDPKAGPALTEIVFTSSSTNTGYVTATSFGNTTVPSELNSGTTKHNSSIYCHYKSSVSQVLDSAEIRSAYAQYLTLNQSDYSASSWSTLTAAATAAKTQIDSLDTNGYSSKTQAQLTVLADNVTQAASSLSHTVNYYNYDGSFLYTETVAHGSPALYSVTPVKPASGIYKYVFDGWSESLVTVNSNMNVTAQFSEVHNHKGGLATCESKAVCEICGEEYGDISPDNHTSTEFRNSLSATCVTPGYSGDLYCTACNTLILSGSATAATGAHYGGKATCVTKAVCIVCSQEYGNLDSSNHVNTELINVSAPGCASMGYSGDTICKDCNTVIKNGSAISATGAHIGGTATCVNKAVCTICGQSYGEVNSENHVNTETRNAFEPTCGTDGYTGNTYCKDCNKKLSEGSTVAATGNHTGGTATCVSKAVCTVCSQAYGEINSGNHVNTEIRNAFEPTCGTEGYTGDSYCKDCNKKLSGGSAVAATGNHMGGTATCVSKAVCTVCAQAYGEVNSENHINAETRNAFEPTCGADGYTGDIYCTACNTVITYGKTINATGNHTGGTATCVSKAVCIICGQSYGEFNPDKHINTEVINALAPTCGTDGYTGDTQCKDCNTVISLGNTIKATGNHTGGTASCSLKAVCTVCGHTYGEVDSENHINTEIINAVLATCGADGYTGDTHCKDCDSIILHGNTLPATGNHIGGTATCSAKAICTLCGQSYGEFNTNNHVNTTIINAAPATCGAAGYTGDTYCTDCNTTISYGTEIAATGNHTGGTATCINKAVCAVCGSEYGNLNTSNHGITQVKYVTTATCTSDGYTGDVCCTDCNAVLSAGRVISKTGHSYSDWTVSQAPTCISNGLETRTCAACGFIENRNIGAKGHTLSDWTVTAPASCTQRGIKMRSCSECDYYQEDKIPATGHSDSNNDGICDICGNDISNPSENCSCNCHKTDFFSKLFWKIKVFFWKIFGVGNNRICECGEAHW